MVGLVTNYLASYTSYVHDCCGANSTNIKYVFDLRVERTDVSAPLVVFVGVDLGTTI